jgi:serine/threonine protein kinase/WD40 repeat protein
MSSDPRTPDPRADTFEAAKVRLRSANASPTPQILTPVRSHTPLPQIDGYEILEELGRGGMGVVYKARQVALNRLVATKMISVGAFASPVQLARFRCEAEAVARLQHPNIVQIFDVGMCNVVGGTGEPCPYFSIEYVSGGTLARRIAGRPHPPREAAAVVETLARAIHYAHERGIVHRDLKPANILLCGPEQASSFLQETDGNARDSLDEEGKGASRLDAQQGKRPCLPYDLKITDFGLAKMLDRVGEGCTVSGVVLGTPHYMAPEQVTGKRDIGPACDTWALGVILYEMLSGRRPFTGETEWRVLGELITEEPASLGLSRGVPADLEVICFRCLRKEPGQRYASAHELAEDLRRYLANEPIRARPVTSAERLFRWCRRNPALAVLLGGIAILLIAITVGSVLAAWHINEARHQAERNADAEKEAREEAQLAQERATLASAESHRRLVQLYVATGVSHAEMNAPWLALLWYNRAWQADTREGQEENHRLRLAATLQRCPELTGVCFHQQPVVDAALHPTQPRVLSWTQQPQAFLWDAARSRLLVPPLEQGGRVLHAAFSPDGQALVTTGENGQAHLRDAETGRVLSRPLLHPEAVPWAAFAPDGKVLATACTDGIVRLWTVPEGTSLPVTIRCQTGVGFVEFSADGTRLLTAEQAGGARVWAVADGKPLTPKLPHSLSPADSLGRVMTPSFSPDGKRALTAWDRSVACWDVATGKATFPPVGVSSRINQAIFNPDGKLILLAHKSQNARLVRVEDGKWLASVQHPREIQHGCFSPDGQRLATHSSGGLIQLRNVRRPDHILMSIRHAGFAGRLRFSRDGRSLLTASRDGTVRLWRVDGEGGRAQAYDFNCGRADRMLSPQFGGVAVSPDGRRELRRQTPTEVGLYQRKGPTAGPTFPHPEMVSYFSFSPDGNRVVVAGKTSCRVWNVDGGRPAGPAIALNKPLVGTRFSDKGGRLLTVDGERKSRVFDVATGRLLAGPYGPISPQGALSPDGRRAAVCIMLRSVDFVEVVNLESGKSFRIGGMNLVQAVEFSPDGRQVVVASSNTTARVYDAETGQPAGPPLHHNTFVRRADFSPDGRWLLTAEDTRLRVWDARTGEPLGLASPWTGSPQRVWFSRDGQRLVGLTSKGGFQWDLPRFGTRKDLVPHLVRLLSGGQIDETEGVVFLDEHVLINDRERYRRAWLSWRGLPEETPTGP